MKTALAVFAFSIWSVNVLCAQSFPGTWQGEMNRPGASNADLRVILKISASATDKLVADLFLIQDQQSVEPPVTSINASGNALRITIDRLNAGYEGRMSAAGDAIQGTWIQHGKPAPLTFLRATSETAWAIPEPPPPPKMMDSNATAEFEVATIKPSDPNRPGWRIGLDPSGVSTLNTTLLDLITFAYDVHSTQVIGAAAWADTDRFDIVAKPDMPGMPNISQMKVMLRKLLADRFSFVFHESRNPLPAYAITVMESGLKITKEEHSADPLYGIAGQPQHGFNVGNATIAEFASSLQMQFMELPVVDQTGLGGARFSFVIKFTPDSWMHPVGNSLPPDAQAAAIDPTAPPDLFSAMERQLGLRLRKTKAPVDVMIVDKVEKPSPN